MEEAKQHQREAQTRREIARLWMQVQPNLIAFITASVQDFCDAEDVLQDVAQIVAERFESYDRSRPFIAWALGITRVKIADHYRHRQKKGFTLSDASLDYLSAATARAEPSMSERNHALEQCLKLLPTKSARIIQLRYQQDCSATQIAADLGSTPKSIRVTLCRIRTQLLDCVRKRLAGGAST
jgi:RNA polymerase sigma-70 factor (ECF subfamily)